MWFKVLIATSTLAWGVNFPAHFVIVKGTEFYDGKLKRYVDMPITDVLQMMGRAGRPQYDNMGIALIMVNFYLIKSVLIIVSIFFFFLCVLRFMT